MHLQRSQKTILVKSYTILLERSAYAIDYIHYIYQSCFRTGGSTTETLWFAVPEPFMALGRYKYALIELVSALYERDCVFSAPGICYVVDTLYSRVCLLSHAPRVQSAISGHPRTYPSIFEGLR